MTEATIQTVDKKLTDSAFFADEDRFYDLFAQLRCDGPVHWTVGPDGEDYGPYSKMRIQGDS